MRRKLCILLAIMMMATMLPMSAFAYSTGNDYPYANEVYGRYLKVDEDPWNFYHRECTSFVAWCLTSRNGVKDFTNWYGGVRWGDAKNWGNAARSIGIRVDSTPAVGSVYWKDSGWYGHVAWVKAVNGNNVTIEEYNYDYQGNYNERTVSSSNASGFIHIKDIDTAPAQVEVEKGSPIGPGAMTVLDGDYYIVTALDSAKVVDVTGNASSDRTNIQIYQKGNYDYSIEAQVFHVVRNSDGYYTITNKKSGKAIDVADASLEKGANIQLYKANGTAAQKWVIEFSGDQEWYAIRSACNGWYADVEGGVSANHTNVRLWRGNGSNAQKWKFIPYGPAVGKTVPDGEYRIASMVGSDKGLNAENAGKTNGTNVNIYANLNDANQTWRLKYLNDGYYNIINVNSGLVLDASQGGQKWGTNVWLYQDAGHDNAKWIVKKGSGNYYYIISKVNGLYLDIPNGSNVNSANVQLWRGNDSNAQRWQFTPVSSASSTASTASPASSTVSTTGTSTTTSKVAVTGVKLSKSSLSLKAGKSSTLTATVTPSNAANKNVTWSTSNAKVAKVVNGKVTAVAAGTAKITVTTADGKKTATCTVTVR